MADSQPPQDDMFAPAQTAARPEPRPLPPADEPLDEGQRILIQAAHVVMNGEGVRELLERVVMLHNVALGAHEQAAALDRFTAALSDPHRGIPRLIEEMQLLRGAISNKLHSV